MLGRIALPGRRLKGYFDLPRNAIEERLLDGLLKLVVKEDFDHGAIDRRLRQFEHPLERFVDKADALCSVRDHHSLNHAGEDRFQAEALVANLLIELLEQFGNPPHVAGGFPKNSFAGAEQRQAGNHPAHSLRKTARSWFKGTTIRK